MEAKKLSADDRLLGSASGAVMVVPPMTLNENPSELTIDPQISSGFRWRSLANRAMGGSLVASGGLQLVVIVSGVLVARSLGPRDRGYLALIVLVSGLCPVVASLGLPSGVTFYLARNAAHARKIVTSLVWLVLAQLSVALVVQIAVFAALVAHDPRQVKVGAALSLLIVPGILALCYALAILQGQQRFMAFNIFRILPSVVYVPGVLIVYLLGLADLVDIVIIWTITNLVGGCVALAVAVRGLPTGPTTGTPPARLDMVKFGAKGFFGSISPVDALNLDQAAVGVFLSPVALGLYVVAQAFTNLPRVVAASIGWVVYPQVAAQPDLALARQAWRRYFTVGVALIGVVVGALELATGDLIKLFFGSEFSGATAIARTLLLGSFFVAARRILTDGANGMGYPTLGTLSEVASWFFLFPGMAILLPRLGAEGVALSLTISWVASFMILLVLVSVRGTRMSLRLRTNDTT